MRVPDNVLEALRSADVDGSRLVLSGPRMDARTYRQVNEVLEAVGGQWTKAAGAHLFRIDAAEAIAPVLAAGQVVTLREKRNDAQYFPTPAAVVTRLVELADLRAGVEVLEPSAGSGAIATAVASRGAVVDCFERDPGYAAELAQAGAARSVQVADFLAVVPQKIYNRVVMNPPFTRQADVEHVTHALQFLKPGGLLVAVMSDGVTFQKGPAGQFRDLVEQHRGTVEHLKAGAFAESGTGVKTVIVTVPADRGSVRSTIAWDRQEEPTESFEAEALEEPAVIAAEITANLREAAKQFEHVARALAKPSAPSLRPVAELPLPSSQAGQLCFDETDEAS
ncbi:methyltransferase (plasmid) [Streptomyces platensis]|uniref:methyltransferase n=1 Tax=Streptomyces platensis TaxID=58346 RepID=UPI002ED64B90|nr:methyltransferase [Streptomyces platensis]